MASCVFSSVRGRLDGLPGEGVEVGDEECNKDDASGAPVAGGVREPDLRGVVLSS